MKTVFLASVAAATLMAAPALAQDAVGSAGIAYGYADIEGNDIDAARLDGVAAFEVAPKWTVTVAGDVTYTDTDFGDDTAAGLAAHLTRSFANDIRAGAFVGMSDIGGEDVATFGAEVQKYYDNTTLTAVVAHTDMDYADALTVGADAAYYVNPSLRLNAGLVYADIDTDLGHADGWAYGAGAEYQFANSPFSVFGKYQHVDIEGLDADIVMVGARYNFGGTLQSLDRAGANLGRSMATLISNAF
jgi:opacity protein-like surface antigen